MVMNAVFNILAETHTQGSRLGNPPFVTALFTTANLLGSGICQKCFI